MGTHNHEHAWRNVLAPRTHFVDEPNSRRRSKPIEPVVCAACGQRGFRYPPRAVVYTWDRDPANWLMEL